MHTIIIYLKKRGERGKTNVCLASDGRESSPVMAKPTHRRQPRAVDDKMSRLEGSFLELNLKSACSAILYCMCSSLLCKPGRVVGKCFTACAVWPLSNSWIQLELFVFPARFMGDRVGAGMGIEVLYIAPCNGAVICKD